MDKKYNYRDLFIIVFGIVILILGFQYANLAGRMESIDNALTALADETGQIHREIRVLENNTVSPGEMYQHVDEIFSETWDKYQVDPSNFDWGLSMHISRVEQQADDIYFWQMDLIRCIEDAGVKQVSQIPPCIRAINSARYCVMTQDGCTEADLYMKQVLGWESSNEQ